MNYMKQVAEMLGVELGEAFDIKNREELAGRHDFKLTEDGLFIKFDEGWEKDIDDFLCELLTGESELIKKPWKPMEGDTYYSVCRNGTINSFYMLKNGVDAAIIAFGNCFKTREEAEAHAEEIVAKIKAVFEK